MAIVGALRSWPSTTRRPLPSVNRSTASAGFGMFRVVAAAVRGVVVRLVGARFAVVRFVAAAERFAAVVPAACFGARFAAVVFLVVAMWPPTLDPRQLGEPGHQHLHHELLGPRL